MSSEEVYWIVRTASLTLPAWELVALLSVMAACLLFEYTKVGLVAAYVFVFRWGVNFFMGLPRDYYTAYLAFGVVVGVLSVVGTLPSVRRVRR